MEERLYSINNFTYWIEKYNGQILNEEKFTKSQIATIIAQAMINFFDSSETPY